MRSEPCSAALCRNTIGEGACPDKGTSHGEDKESKKESLAEFPYRPRAEEERCFFSMPRQGLWQEQTLSSAPCAPLPTVALPGLSSGHSTTGAELPERDPERQPHVHEFSSAFPWVGRPASLSVGLLVGAHGFIPISRGSCGWKRLVF